MRRNEVIERLAISLLLILCLGAPACSSNSKKANTLSEGPPASDKDARAISPVWTLPKKHEPQSIESYWTPARMRSAKPYDLRGSPEQRPSNDSGASRETEPPSGVDPQLPRRAGMPPKLSRDTTLLLPGVRFARLWLGSNRSAPASTFGKIFFDRKGEPYVCSGTVVTSKNKSVVWTAGHCIYDEAGVHTNWIFVPGYKRGAKPFGTFRASDAHSMFAPNAWFDSLDQRFDVAGVAVRPIRGTQNVEDAVGSQGIKFNQSPRETFAAFGYPEADPFNGERLYWCNSAVRGRGYPQGTGPATLQIDCDMSGGSSGGGWIIGSYKGHVGWGWVNSVVSYHNDDKATPKFGPYMGKVAREVWDLAQTYGLS